jgi:hypothetical protein
MRIVTESANPLDKSSRRHFPELERASGAHREVIASPSTERSQSRFP